LSGIIVLSPLNIESLFDRSALSQVVAGLDRAWARATAPANSEVGRLMEFRNRLGQDVRITVRPTRKRLGEMEAVT
jgi:hypothetical protein